MSNDTVYMQRRADLRVFPLDEKKYNEAEWVLGSLESNGEKVNGVEVRKFVPMPEPTPEPTVDEPENDEEDE